MEIIEIALQNIITGEASHLIKKEKGNGGLSRNWFLEPIDFGEYKIQLRFDLKDINKNGDPVLDADIYRNEKKIKNDIWHHTEKKFNDEKGLWIYVLEFNDLKLELQTKCTINSSIGGKARIIRGPDPISQDNDSKESLIEELL